MLTTRVTSAKDSKKSWPSLAAGTSTSTSFFKDDKKIVHVTGNKSMMSTPQPSAPTDDDLPEDDEGIECKAPIYKNNLGDCLASALAKSCMNDMSSSSASPQSKGKKKKAKKTLLFASGMNFN